MNLLRPPTQVRRLAWCLVWIAALILLDGCKGQPQLGASNLRLLAGLRTAVSSRRPDWVQNTAKLITQRHAAGDLTDDQAAALEEIVALANADQWSEAESAVIRLEKAQRPGS